MMGLAELPALHSRERQATDERAKLGICVIQVATICSTSRCEMAAFIQGTGCTVLDAGDLSALLGQPSRCPAVF